MMAIKHSKTRGFTLLEIMLTIAIIGILATVSYGSYQRYIARANVADLVLRIDAMRTAFTVLDAEDGGIPSFAASQTAGIIPPELSQLALQDDDLKYPGLAMYIHDRGGNRQFNPYLLIASRSYADNATLVALSEILPHRQFAWLAEPIVAMVPMIGAIEVMGNKHLPPQGAATPAPIPTSSSKFNIVPNP